MENYDMEKETKELFDDLVVHVRTWCETRAWADCVVLLDWKASIVYDCRPGSLMDQLVPVSHRVNIGVYLLPGEDLTLDRRREITDLGLTFSTRNTYCQAVYCSSDVRNYKFLLWSR